MNLSSFIGQRISFRQDGRKLSAGVVIAVTGISVSYVIMLLAISIVTGFKNQIIDRLTGFNAQITIMPPLPAEGEDGLEPIALTPELRKSIHDINPDAAISLSFNQPAVFKTDSAFQGIVLRGIAHDGNWDFVRNNLVQGNIPDSGHVEEVVMSSLTASALGVRCGDKIVTHFFDGNNLRSRNLHISGIYDSHFNDFDNMLAFTPIGMLQQLFNVDSLKSTSIEIRGLPQDEVDEVSVRLYESLMAGAMSESMRTGENPFLYRIENINQQCAMYINWLNLLDTNVLVIIILMAFISGFTLISSLFIIILERVNMIGIFKAMGASDSQIRRIFIYMAQRLVVRGLVIGNVIALSIIFAQIHFHLLPLDPEAYYLNYVPMDLSWWSVLALNIAVIIISALILILPSYLISTLSPAKSIRYE